MSIKEVVLILIVAQITISSCNQSEKLKTQTVNQDSLNNIPKKEMKSSISMIEIPANDISRAIQFYQSILDIKIEKMDADGMQMGIFPYEDQMVTSVIVKADGYKPSSDGVTVYLNAGENLQLSLNKVEENGGKILIPKTAHLDRSGYFAIFLDSEGNKMALNSKK